MDEGLGQAPGRTPGRTPDGDRRDPRDRRNRRDRRGRGMRGPGLLPLAPDASVTRTRTRSERFDTLVLDVVTELDERWSDRLGLLEYAVEDAPRLPDDWHPDDVPLASLVRGARGAPTRLVVFRRPIEHRAESRSELEALVLTVVVEQLAELLGIDAELVDPRYRRSD